MSRSEINQIFRFLYSNPKSQLIDFFLLKVVSIKPDIVAESDVNAKLISNDSHVETLRPLVLIDR